MIINVFQEYQLLTGFIATIVIDNLHRDISFNSERKSCQILYFMAKCFISTAKRYYKLRYCPLNITKGNANNITFYLEHLRYP